MAKVILRGFTGILGAAIATSCAVPPPTSGPPQDEARMPDAPPGGYATQQYRSLFSQRAQWVYHDRSWRYVRPGQYSFSGWVYTLLPWWGWVWVWFPMSYTGWIYVWSFGWAYIGGFAWPGPWGGGWPPGPSWEGGGRGFRPIVARPGATIDLPAYAARDSRTGERMTQPLQAPRSAPGAPPFGGSAPSGRPSQTQGPTGGPGSGPPDFGRGGPMGPPPGAPPEAPR